MKELTDLAYAAGYTDGDGCFHVGKYRSENRIRYSRIFIINSTELENVQWFQRTFGGTISSKKGRKSNHKTIYRYTLKGNQFAELKNIGSFLNEKIHEYVLFEQFGNPLFEKDRDKIIEEMNFIKKHFNLVEIKLKNTFESLRNTIQPTKEDFAYLAGFVDAECCINVQRAVPKNRPNPTYKIQLQCNNSKSPTFKWISERFGGQFHFIDRNRFPNNRNQMTWRISSASLYPILESIFPFLKHKKAVCEELIKFYQTTFKRFGQPSPRSPHFAAFYRPILEEREAIFHKIQSLNKKGI